MYVKLHKSYRTVVAICDSDLIGKKFEEKFKDGIKQLDIRENFYKGQEMPESEVISLIKREYKEDATFNIIGKESCKAAEKAGLVDAKFVKKIKGIPYVLVLM